MSGVRRMSSPPSSSPWIPSEIKCPICGASVVLWECDNGDRVWCDCNNCGYGTANETRLKYGKGVQKFLQYKKTGEREVPWLPLGSTGGDLEYEIRPAEGQRGNLVWRRRERWTSGRYSGRLSQRWVAYDSHKEAASASHDDVVALLRQMRTREKITLLRSSQSFV